MIPGRLGVSTFIGKTKLVSKEYCNTYVGRWKRDKDENVKIVHLPRYSKEEMKPIRSHIMKQNADFQKGIALA